MMGEKKEEHRVFCLGLTVQQIASFSDSEKESRRRVKLKAQVRTRLMFRPFGALPHSFRPVCLTRARARSLRYVYAVGEGGPLKDARYQLHWWQRGRLGTGGKYSRPAYADRP